MKFGGPNAGAREPNFKPMTVETGARSTIGQLPAVKLVNNRASGTERRTLCLTGPSLNTKDM